MTLKVLPISYFRYNTEEKKHKIPNSKYEAGEIRVSLRMFYNQILRRFQENDRFLKIFLLICLKKFTNSFQSFTKFYSFGDSYK